MNTHEFVKPRGRPPKNGDYKCADCGVKKSEHPQPEDWPELRQLLPVKKVSEILSCSIPHVEDLAAAGHFRIVKIGTRSRRVFRDQLDAYLDSL